MPWRQRILLIVLLLLVALALLWAFLPRAVPVETAKVSRGPLRVTVEEEGKAPLRARFVISAPVAGYARRVALEVGDPVKRGQAVAEIEPMRAEGLHPRTPADAVRIRPGTPVRFERWGGDVPLEGKVRMVEPVGFTKVSALGVEEQRVLVVADITTPREVWQGVGDGYRLEASFILWEEKNVLQVPAGALFRTGDRFAVYVVENGRAKARSVAIGRRNGLAAQLLSGLKEGETVILHPGDTAAAGRKGRARA